MPTVLGLIVAPPALLWAGRPERLVQLAMIASVFEAAAAAVIGGFGLPLAMVPGLVFIAHVAVQYLLGTRYPGERVAFWCMTPLLLLLGYALGSAMLLPGTFAGKVMVWPQKPDPYGVVAVPLMPSAANVTQSLYLLINASVSLSAALYLTNRAAACGGILRAYLAAGYVAVLVGFWDFARRIAPGVPFPADVFYSNPWAILDQQSVGDAGVPRVSGSFAEPSSLGGYLAGVAFCSLWLSLRGHEVLRPRLLLALSVLMVALSTSASGLATLAMGFPLLLALNLARTRGRGLRKLAALLALAACGASVVLGPLLIARPEILDAAGTVIDATLNKHESESYEERMAINRDAIQAAMDTYGLGVGWGSFRAMSLVPGVLANGGVFGAAMLLWLWVRVGQLAKRAGEGGGRDSALAVVGGFGAALLAQIMTSLLASGNLTGLVFFLQLGCVVGAGARLCLSARTSTDGAATAASQRQLCAQG